MVRPSALKPCAWPARAAPRWWPRARQQRQIALPGAEGGLASLAHRPPWSGRSAGPARGQQTAGPRTGGVKKSHRYFFCHPDPVSQLPFIGQQRLHYPVQLLCHVLSVVAGRYYARCQRATIRPAIKGKPAWETAMVDIFDHRRYGTSRPQVGLREPGYRVGRQALRTALCRHSRRAWQPRARPAHDRFDPRAALRPEPAARPAASDPGQSGVGQRHLLPTASSQWVYCCAFQDACIKQVVG